jgi:hypothetical protein
MQTIVKEFYQIILGIHMNPSAKKYIIVKLAEIEYQLSVGGSEKLALGNLVGAFYQAREIKDEAS